MSIDDLISGYGVGHALDRDVPTLVAVDPLANSGVRFIRYEDFTRYGGSFEPRREVHAAANDRVVHPIIAAEVPDSTISCIDSDPTLEGFFDAGRPPQLLELAHSLAHGYG